MTAYVIAYVPPNHINLAWFKCNIETNHFEVAKFEFVLMVQTLSFREAQIFSQKRLLPGKRFTISNNLSESLILDKQCFPDASKTSN